MSSARSDLFIYIGVALATTIGLFALHRWYGTVVDVRYHAELAEGGPSEALLAARDEEAKALQSGKMPLPQAIQTFAQKGRPASITPVPSQDLSPVSGWIHARDFQPATGHAVRVPAPSRPVRAEPEPPQAVDPATAPTAPDWGTGAAPRTPASGAEQLRLKTEVLKERIQR